MTYDDTSRVDGAGTRVAEQPAKRKRGRPRDPDIDGRILDAAMAVYGERGWTGFNFDVIARRARVSKDAIYRRYESPVSLLLAAWSGSRVPEQHRYEAGLPDDATIGDFLRAVAADHLAGFSRETGFDYLRVYVEAKHHPEVLEAFLKDRTLDNVTRIRGTVRAAMDRGLLPAAGSATAILDAIIGGVAMHVMVTPPELRQQMVDRADAYLDELINLILRGCGYDFSQSVPIAPFRQPVEPVLA